MSGAIAVATNGFVDGTARNKDRISLSAQSSKVTDHQSAMKEDLQNQMECWVTQAGSELETNQARVQICSCGENLTHQC